MNDRELLELAAKAAGFTNAEWKEYANAPPTMVVRYERPVDGITGYQWNPLTDDGDALRLAVNLRLLVDNGPTLSTVVHEQIDPIEIEHNGNPEAATRIAIVNAAAEIGKAM